MVPVTSDYGHLVTSFGLGVLKPVYALLDEIIADGVVAKQQFSVDPRPLQKGVPVTLLQSLVFRLMYSKQTEYEARLQKLGLMGDDAFTCACYQPETGNTPQQGQVLSWAESSAVVYANSVLGARCNRNSGIIDIFGSIAGFVPEFGLLTDEGRRATWVVELKTTKLPPAQVLGSAIGMLFSGGIVPSYIMWTRIFHINDTIWALIIPNYLMNAFNVLLVRNYFKNNIPDAIIESAQIDGAGEGRILFRIMPSGLMMHLPGRPNTYGSSEEWVEPSRSPRLPESGRVL